jgi:hypothetical protein
MPNYTTLREMMVAERTRLLLTRFQELDDDIELNSVEVSIITNRSNSTLKIWEKIPGHPIKWRRHGKQKSSTVGCVREFLKTEQRRQGRPRKQPLATEATTIT